MSTRKELVTRLAQELAPALSHEATEKVAAPRLPRPTTMPGYKSPAPPSKKPVNGQGIRKGYYEAGDNIYSLEEAVKSDPNTKGDAALVKAVEDLQKAHHAVFNALKPYNWD